MAVHLLLMLRTCDSTSAEVKEVCSYSSAAVFEDVCGGTSTSDVKDM